jgi:hypothetical protein
MLPCFTAPDVRQGSSSGLRRRSSPDLGGRGGVRWFDPQRRLASGAIRQQARNDFHYKRRLPRDLLISEPDDVIAIE